MCMECSVVVVFFDAFVFCSWGGRERENEREREREGESKFHDKNERRFKKHLLGSKFDLLDSEIRYRGEREMLLVDDVIEESLQLFESGAEIRLTGHTHLQRRDHLYPWQQITQKRQNQIERRH